MRKTFPFLVLLLAGCTEDAVSLTHEIMTVETERVDCLMKVVDDQSAMDFCKFYQPKLKDRNKVLKDRLDNIKKVFEKKDKKEFEEFEKSETLVEARGNLAQRAKFQEAHLQAIFLRAEEEAEGDVEKMKGFTKLKNMDWGSLTK